MPRQHERVPYLTEIVLEFASGRREARISDLSEGGCFVECLCSVRPGDAVRFDLRVPGASDAVPVEGEVTYVFDGMGFGLKFSRLTDEAGLRIGCLVASMEPTSLAG